MIHLARAHFFKVLAASLASMALMPGIAQSQPADYPSKPIKIVVPAGPGGAADILARALAERMGASMKTSFAVENKGGAGGLIGADAVAKAAPDGYTLLLTSNTLVISTSLMKAPYDPQKDFAPVGLVATAPNIIAAGQEVKVKTLGEFIALARKSPGTLTYGSPAVGSSAHLTIEMLARSADLQLTHVPFKGPQQALMETLAGRVPLTISGVSNVLPHMASGKLVPLAVTGTRRSPLAPTVPTLSELGIKDVNITLWFGLFAPAGTPAAALAKLNENLNAALKGPEMVRQLAALGFDPVGGSSADLAETVRRDEPAFASVVKSAGIKAD